MAHLGEAAAGGAFHLAHARIAGAEGQFFELTLAGGEHLAEFFHDIRACLQDRAKLVLVDPQRAQIGQSDHDGASAVRLLAKIEAPNPDKHTSHVIWDNAACYRGPDVRAFLARAECPASI